MTQTDSQPHLLMLCQLFYPELISTGQTLTELGEQLAASGVSVQVVCGPPTVMDHRSRVPRDMVYQNIQIHRVRATRFPKLNLIGRIINQITFAVSVLLYLLVHRPRGPILVLTNPPFLALACAMLRALRWIGPYHYLIFDVYPDTAVRLGLLKDNGLLTRLWNWTNKLSWCYSQTIIVIGRCMADLISQKLDESGHPEYKKKIKRIHIWTDDRLIASTQATVNPYLENWQLKGKFVVGYFGNMGRFHDIETILEAARQLREFNDILFLFVGEGHKKAMALEYVSNWNLNNCHFETYVAREKLGYSLTAADIGLVSLQAGQEGLSVPSKTMALMAAARPVLAIMSEKSEIARLIHEQKCGRVISPGDARALATAILEFYHDRQLGQALGHNGLQAIQTQLNLKQATQLIHNIIFQ